MHRARSLDGPRRALLAAVAVLMLAAVAPQWRQQRAIDGALATARAGDLNAGRDELTRARDLGPDTRPRLREAQFLVLMRRPAQARAVLAPVLASEPSNLDAWQTMRLIADALHDVPLRQQVERAIVTLDPFGPPS